ncbi:MAG TPA: S41 family peptidase [Clostridiaceae bacterium]|nr:S41 family peptidase [Clostridiaceae bacterium]
MQKKSTLILSIIIIIITTSVITFSISAVFFLGPAFNNKYQILFDQESVNYENIKKFNQVRNALKTYYYEEVDENVLLEGAIAGMAASLKDPYTVYYTKEQMEKIMEMPKRTEETYVGIGVSIITDENGLVTVVEPFYGSPAYEAGIKQGDKIIAVNDEDVTTLKDETAIVNMIKGPENTTVKITVFRPSEGRSIEFELVRKKITYLYNLRSEILDGNIGYIRIISFLDDKIDQEFKEQLNNFLKQNIKGLIIDVRDNPGGYYHKVIKIADRLLPDGNVIVYTEDRNKKVDKEYASDGAELNIPLAILVNENSASASEILAGAIKDHKKGAIIGMKTFGKGLVQDLKTLDDGSGIKITVSRYFTPSGVCIHGTGVEPDIEVKLDEKYNYTPISQIPKDDDAQLQKAIEVINRLAGQ